MTAPNLSGLSPAEAGQALARSAPPLRPEQAEQAARILAAVATEQLRQAS